MLAAGIFAIAFFLGLVASGVMPAVALLFGGAVLILPFAKLPYGILGTTTPVPGEKTAEELLKEISDNFKTKNTEFEAALKKLKDASDADKTALQKSVDDLQAELKALTDQKITAEKKALEDRLVAMGEEITKIKDANGTVHKVAIKTIGDAIANEIKTKAAEIATFVKGGRGMMPIEVKVAGDMTVANNYTGGNQGLSMLEPGMARIVRRSPFLRQIVNSAATSKPIVKWIEQLNPDPGTAGMTAEGAAKTQTDFDLIERSAESKKITAYIKVSMEMLEDVDFIEGEIRNELVEIVELKFDEQILSGDNTGDNLKGILEYAVAFNAGSLAGTVREANNFDVIRAGVAQVVGNLFRPNYVLVNPIDAASMDLAKGNDGHYVMPPFATVNGQTISGLVVIENTGITAGEFVIGDFTKSNLRIRKDLNIQVGRDGNDFTKNMFTILAEMRAVHYIKTNHVNAFITGTFATAIAALELEVAP